MKFGLFLQPVHPPTEDPTVALHRDLELVVLLDELGYSEAWIGEHHSTGWENIGSPEVFIAVAAERTKRIRLGTGVVQLGLHHPLVALDRLITLDHLTRGRVMFGFGVGGGLPSDLKVFGLTREQAGRRLEEGMDVILRLLNEDEPISVTTDWFELHEAVLQLKPLSDPTFAIASSDPRNVQLMGEVGGYVLSGPTPGRVPDLFEQLEIGASRVGRTASRDQIRLSFAMHLAESRERAMEDIRAGAIAEHYDFNVGVNGAPAPRSEAEMFEGFVNSHIIGTPEDAIAKIEEAVEEAGGFGGILFTSRDWASADASRNSWSLFAREVAPRFQGQLRQQSRAALAAAAINEA